MTRFDLPAINDNGAARAGVPARMRVQLSLRNQPPRQRATNAPNLSRTIAGDRHDFIVPKLPAIDSPEIREFLDGGHRTRDLSPENRRANLAKTYSRADDRPRHVLGQSARVSPSSRATVEYGERAGDDNSPSRADFGQLLASDHPLAQVAQQPQLSGSIRAAQRAEMDSYRAARQQNGRATMYSTTRITAHRIKAGLTTRLPPIEDSGPSIGREAAAAYGFDPSSRPTHRRPDGSENSGSVRIGAPRSNKRTDPLAAFGYRTLGPIAAGAFSTVVRAKQIGGGSTEVACVANEVAVKSFNRAK